MRKRTPEQIKFHDAELVVTEFCCFLAKLRVIGREFGVHVDGPGYEEYGASISGKLIREVNDFVKRLLS